LHHSRGHRARFSAIRRDYLEAAGHGADETAPSFGRSATTERAASRKRSHPTGFTGWCEVFSTARFLRSGPMRCARRPSTNAFDHQADIAKVQEWLGHANIATTRIYDHCKTRPEDSPTFN